MSHLQYAKYAAVRGSVAWEYARLGLDKESEHWAGLYRESERAGVACLCERMVPPCKLRGCVVCVKAFRGCVRDYYAKRVRP